MIDFDSMLESYHHCLAVLVRGNPDAYQAMYSHRDDATLANPFGPPARGWKEVEPTIGRAASFYRDGEVDGFENLAKYVTPELAYTLELERFRAKVAGGTELSSITLRTTTVFRPEEGEWKIVHRHADPISRAQGPQSIINA